MKFGNRVLTKLKMWTKHAALWSPLYKIVLTYTVVICGLFPLYMDNGYMNIANAKFGFFTVFTLALLVLAALSRLAPQRSNLGVIAQSPYKKTRLSLLFFMAGILLSFAFSSHKSTAFWGLHGRYAGLVLWVLCIAMCLIVGQTLRPRHTNFIVGFFCITSSLVCLLAVLNHFGLDLLNIYYKVIVRNRPMYISTIGNVNFFSAYLCLFLPCVLYGYVCARSKQMRLGAGLLCLFGTWGLFAANSDGAFGGLLVCLILITVQRTFTTAQFMRLAELGVLFFVCAALFGLLDRATPDKTHVLRNLAALVTRCLPALIGLAACVLVRILLGYLLRQQRPHPPKSLQKYGIIFWLAAGALLVAAVVLANTVFHNADWNIFAKFLHLDAQWGNHRGYVWAVTVRHMVEHFTPLQWLFGTGPDTMTFLLNPEHTQAIAAISGQHFDSTHNEYLQLLACTGVVGLAGFLWALLVRLKNLFSPRNDPVEKAVLLAVAAYAAQAFINISNPNVLPLLFLMLALADSRFNTVAAMETPAVSRLSSKATGWRGVVAQVWPVLAAGVVAGLLYLAHWLTRHLPNILNWRPME